MIERSALSPSKNLEDNNKHSRNKPNAPAKAGLTTDQKGNGAIRVVPLSSVPKGTKLISVRFAEFDIQEDGKGVDARSRIAVKGFMQKKGVDVGETYIPTPDPSTLLTFFALATLEELECVLR
eukprot:g18183.t1